MLLDFVETTLDAQQIGDLLTMAGFELEGIEEVEGEPVLDIKVMSNRGDGLSVFGLAREILAKDEYSNPTALYHRAATRFLGGRSDGENPTKVTIETEDCTRFACRLWTGIENGHSPELIQTRLRKTGQRTISRLVDLTNYVMLELGQPLHVFDFDKVSGGQIVVRKARVGEKLTTLNGDEHELRPDQMMICDAKGPIGVAGVMGGLASEVSESTTRVLLESAHFLNTSVRRTRKQLGLNTDASYRFERSVDPEGVVAAIERFTELLGVFGSEIVDVYPGKVEREAIAVRVPRASTLLGMEIKETQAQHYFQRLGMEVAGHGNPFLVIPPTWRPDIVREIDLIEELGRVHGYDRIPETLPQGSSLIGGPKGSLLAEDRLRESMLRLGFIQTISHSLRSAHPLDDLGERIGPRNPSSPEMALLRNSLLPCLAEAAVRNGGRDLHLFEIGKVFSPGVETKQLAILSTGALIPPTRKGEVTVFADFYSLKGAIEESLASIGYELELETPDVTDRRLHPTRQSLLFVNQTACGIIGQIHPDVAKASDLPEATILAEIDVDWLLSNQTAGLKLHSVSRHPAVRRDIAVLVDKSVSYSDVVDAVRAGAGDLLEKQWLFDVFDGQGIPDGKHSLGIGIQLRKPDGTFTDAEANQVRDSIVSELASLGASTR